MASRDNFGAKTGGGGIASATTTELHRKHRLEELVSLEEKYQLKSDPFFFKNRQGQYECKICYTSHRTIESYLTHRVGKKHIQSVKKYMSKQNKQKRPAKAPTHQAQQPRKFLKIGKPAFRLSEVRSPQTSSISISKCGILFELELPRIREGVDPVWRIVSSFEQRVEAPDPSLQFLVVAAEPYESVAVRMPNRPVAADPAVHELWDKERKMYQLQIFFENEE
eukprot:gnl/Dysnectes_brevis/4344_a5789_702.p1 GENE.gnl/Dysnectes_brevis/4344_a5789_702~~gnl/Dysnectes_brevis/4344_a5789_702.p1  ORF type:complete len:223 (+),score=19.70 gnl/Dysnectes_brevis/4344_a5789_702:90-758(+)